MKCTDIKIHIDDYLDRRLLLEKRFSFEQHVAGCVECAGSLKLARSVLTGLQDLDVPEPSANFQQRVFKEVRRQYKDEKQEYRGFSFATGFATAAVASLAIWFVSSLYLPDTSIKQSQVVSLEMNQAKTVRLMFDAPDDIQQVKLSIDIPDNMHVDGYPGRKVLAWETSLQKGQNILALPIIADGQGQGELFAQLTYGNTVKTFTVLLITSIDGVQNYHLNDIKLV